MNNIRQKINQLRIAYFMPTRPIEHSTNATYSPDPVCVDRPVTVYGSYAFHTPCVDYVANICNIAFTSQGVTVVQTAPVCPLTDPFALSSTAYCVPRRISVGSVSPLRFRVNDYSNYLRTGYSNHFHQVIHTTSEWYAQFPQISYLNLYF